MATANVLEPLEQIQVKGKAVGIDTNFDLVGQSAQEDLCYEITLFFLICCWLFSVTDAN